MNGKKKILKKTGWKNCKQHQQQGKGEEVTRRRHRPRRPVMVVSRRKYNIWQAVIMACIVVLGEVHTFWEKSDIAGKWIYDYPWEFPIRLQNYVSDNAGMINWILLSVFAYRLGKRPTNFSFWLLSLFIIWKAVNIPFYWYNYRTFGYGWVYVGLILVGALTYKRFNKR